MTDTLTETINLTKEFDGTCVLNDICVEIKKKEIFGIIGENGAGKSTFIKLLNGTHSPTEGKIKFEGQEINMGIDCAKELGINTIPQEFNLINPLNVYENIFLGQEYNKKIFLDRKKMKSITKELLNNLNTDIDPSKRVGDLSAADKQIIEIAKAIAYNSKLLIMDEPTTVLTSNEIEALFGLMRDLKENGVTIIYISHKLAEIKEICDRVMVLRDGEFVSVNSIDELTTEEMANRMVGRKFNTIFSPKNECSNEKILEVKDLNVPGILKDINFVLNKGEVLGLSGLLGAGRTELAEALYGIRRKSKGDIFLHGEKVEIQSPRDAVRQKIALLPEDRQNTGLLTEFDLSSNINLTSFAINNEFLIKYKKEVAKTKEYIDKFDINTPDLYSKVKQLSGGNQQKISIAKSLDINPDVFIFDEPTRGIDIGAKMEIFDFIHELVNKGISCIFISSELEEIIGMCNRVLVMRSGQISGVLEGEHINEQEIMYYATGLKKQKYI